MSGASGASPSVSNHDIPFNSTDWRRRIVTARSTGPADVVLAGGQVVIRVVAAVRALALLLDEASCVPCRSLSERAAPFVALTAILVVHEAAFALEVIAVGQREAWRSAGKEPLASQVPGCLTGIRADFDRYRVKCR